MLVLHLPVKMRLMCPRYGQRSKFNAERPRRVPMKWNGRFKSVCWIVYSLYSSITFKALLLLVTFSLSSILTLYLISYAYCLLTWSSLCSTIGIPSSQEVLILKSNGNSPIISPNWFKFFKDLLWTVELTLQAGQW